MAEDLAWLWRHIVEVAAFVAVLSFAGGLFIASFKCMRTPLNQLRGDIGALTRDFATHASQLNEVSRLVHESEGRRSTFHQRMNDLQIAIARLEVGMAERAAKLDGLSQRVEDLAQYMRDNSRIGTS